MLVCNVSLLRRRAAIAADIAETTTALDAPGTWQRRVCHFVDDPASVGEHADAFLGQIMLEAQRVPPPPSMPGWFMRCGSMRRRSWPRCYRVVPTISTAAVVEAATAADLPFSMVPRRPGRVSTACWRSMGRSCRQIRNLL